MSHERASAGGERRQAGWGRTSGGGRSVGGWRAAAGGRTMALQRIHRRYVCIKRAGPARAIYVNQLGAPWHLFLKLQEHSAALYHFTDKLKPIRTR